jgi:hypothetical protein
LFRAGFVASAHGPPQLSWRAAGARSNELCDGRPSFVEADLAYWLGTVGRFCPWASYVYAEKG